MKAIDDVDKVLPGTLNDIREWFRVYKVAEGGKENKFGLDEKFMDKDYAMKVIKKGHEHIFNLLPRVAGQ